VEKSRGFQTDKKFFGSEISPPPLQIHSISASSVL
jgi:hypothetical protein